MDYNARYYSPGLGRFVSPDTVVPDPVNPQAWNRYTYALGNPVRYRDSTGHYTCEGMGTCKPSPLPKPTNVQPDPLTSNLTPLPSLDDTQRTVYAQGLDAEAGIFRRTEVQDAGYQLAGNVVANHMRSGATFEDAISIVDSLNPAKNGGLDVYQLANGLPDPSEIGLNTVDSILDGTIGDTTNGATHWVDRSYWTEDALEAYPDLSQGEALTKYMNDLQVQYPDIVSVEYTFDQAGTYSLHAMKDWPPPKIPVFSNVSTP